MKNLNDTINRAISLKGVEILKSGNRFFDVLEDLSPQLVEDLSFIRKAYSDQLGELLYTAVIEGKNTKERRVGEIINYLKNEEGRDEKWVSRVLKCFHKCIYDTNFGEVEPVKISHQRTVRKTKPFVAKSTIYIYKAPGRLIFYISIIVQAICFYLTNNISYHYNEDGVFSYRILSGDWRDLLGIVAFLAFALATIMGKDGMSVFNVVPAFAELFIFFASGRYGGAILVMFYCLVAHISLDLDEASERHHKLVLLDTVILAEIATGVIVGQNFNKYITMIPITRKVEWILYILEFCSIVMMTSYLLNTRKRQIEYRKGYGLKLPLKYEISEIDPDNLLMGFFAGNILLLLAGIIILATRFFQKEAFSLIVGIGLVRVSIVTTLFIILVLYILNSTKYVYKDKKWTTE